MRSLNVRKFRDFLIYQRSRAKKDGERFIKQGNYALVRACKTKLQTIEFILQEFDKRTKDIEKEEVRKE